jgi:hypothetical protein
MRKIRNFLFFLFFLYGAGALAAPPSVILLISKRENLPLRQAASQQLIGRFLVSNPDRTAFTVLISFEEGCNIRHFTTSNALPLQIVTLGWNNGTGSGSTTLYNRALAGQDCIGVLQWTPPDPAPEPYATAYQFDLYADWNTPGKLVALAGIYRETINIVAMENITP